MALSSLGVSSFQSAAAVACYQSDGNPFALPTCDSVVSTMGNALAMQPSQIIIEEDDPLLRVRLSSVS